MSAFKGSGSIRPGYAHGIIQIRTVQLSILVYSAMYRSAAAAVSTLSSAKLGRRVALEQEVRTHGDRPKDARYTSRTLGWFR